MLNSNIAFATDKDISVLALQVSEEIESKDYGAIAAVFKGDDAAEGRSVLYSDEDVFDCCCGLEQVV